MKEIPFLISDPHRGRYMVLLAFIFLFLFFLLFFRHDFVRAIFLEPSLVETPNWVCCLVLRSNFALFLTMQFASLISSLINIISLDVTSFNSAVTLKLKCGKVVCAVFHFRGSLLGRIQGDREPVSLTLVALYKIPIRSQNNNWEGEKKKKSYPRSGASKFFSVRATPEKTKNHAGNLCVCMCVYIYVCVCMSLYIYMYYDIKKEKYTLLIFL